MKFLLALVLLSVRGTQGLTSSPPPSAPLPPSPPSPPLPPSPPPYTTPPGEGSVVLSSEALGNASDALGQGFSFFDYSKFGRQGEARSQRLP
jgi:hypothetical protein